MNRLSKSRRQVRRMPWPGDKILKFIYLNFFKQLSYKILGEVHFTPQHFDTSRQISGKSRRIFGTCRQILDTAPKSPQSKLRQ